MVMMVFYYMSFSDFIHIDSNESVIEHCSKSSDKIKELLIMDAEDKRDPL